MPKYIGNDLVAIIVAQEKLIAELTKELEKAEAQVERWMLIALGFEAELNEKNS